MFGNPGVYILRAKEKAPEATGVRQLVQDKQLGVGNIFDALFQSNGGRPEPGIERTALLTDAYHARIE